MLDAIKQIANKDKRFFLRDANEWGKVEHCISGSHLCKLLREMKHSFESNEKTFENEIQMKFLEFFDRDILSLSDLIASP